MRLAKPWQWDTSALHYAEGSLSSGNPPFMAAWYGCKYIGLPWWKRLPMAIYIMRNMKVRGLKRGFDLNSLRD